MHADVSSAGAPLTPVIQVIQVSLREDEDILHVINNMQHRLTTSWKNTLYLRMKYFTPISQQRYFTLNGTEAMI